MANLLVCFRSFVFVFFIICNAVLCSVSVWNIGLAKSAGLNMEITAFLIFLGAFGLLCAFPIILVDLVRQNALTSRIWFECLWIGMFWILELSGAAAVTANLPNTMCTGQWLNACTSAKIMMTFSWICTATLLLYLVALAACTILHHSTDSEVWHATVRGYAWFGNSSSLPSAPSTPMREKGLARSIAAPQPRHAAPPIKSDGWALSSDLPQKPSQIHDFNDTKHKYLPEAPPVAAPTSAESGRYQRPALPKLSAVPSLYPSQIHSAMSTSTMSTLVNQALNVEPSPPPLGEWPQKGDSQRTKGKTQSPVGSLGASLTECGSLRRVVSGESVSSFARANSVKPRGPRPGSHPRAPSPTPDVRSRSPPRPRWNKRPPPPLNLNAITSVKR